MSRIGKMPITVPPGVEVNINNSQVEIKGPKGVLKREFSPEIEISLDNGVISITRPSDNPNHRSLHGLTRSLLANMVYGVTTGFEKNLEVIGVGYKVEKSGDKLILNVGYSHPVEMDPGSDLEVVVPAANKITVKGIDKEKVGVFAANIRAVRPPEPYKGKGIKYANETIRRKAGKAGVKK